MKKSTSKDKAQADFNKALGATLKNLRMSKGVRLNQLSEQMGITYQQVFKYEKGVDRCTVYRFVSICDILNINPTTALRMATKAANGNECSKLYTTADMYIFESIRKIKSPQKKKVLSALVKLLAEDE